jgi:hypothetical protein
LLLEANIEYTDKFKDILRSIDCLLVVENFYTLIGKEVDINTNYIDIDTDKKDVILFTPDNKTLKLPFIAIDSGYEYTNPADRARRDQDSPLVNYLVHHKVNKLNL